MMHCHKDGCTSGARWSVKFWVDCPEPGGLRRRIGMDCTIVTCDAHQDDVKAYLLSDENRETITTTLMEQAGTLEPDYLTARVEFLPIQREPIEVVPLIAEW